MPQDFEFTRFDCAVDKIRHICRGNQASDLFFLCNVNFIIVSAEFKHMSYIYVNYDLNNIIKLDLVCLFVFNHRDNITLTLYIIETPEGVLWQTVKMTQSGNQTE